MTVYQRKTLCYIQTCPSSRSGVLRQKGSRCVCREGGLDIPGPPPIVPFGPVAVHDVDIEIFWVVEKTKLAYWERLGKRVSVKVIRI